MTHFLLLGDATLAIADLIATLVRLLSIVILIYVLLDLARTFSADLPDIVISIHQGLGRVCEPLFAPVRSVLPPMGGIDFAPLVTLILISVIGEFIVNLLL